MTPAFIRLGVPQLFSLLPKRTRFDLARALAQLAPKRATFGQNFNAVLDDGPSIALFKMGWAMTRAGIEFDPQVDVIGNLPADGRGMLCVSGHFGLNHLLPRVLHDRGWSVLLVRGPIDKPHYIAGTRIEQPFVTQTQQVLVTVRSALRRGDAVLIDIDSHTPLPHAISVGPFHLSDASLRVAEKCGAAIVYVETRLIHGRVRATFTPGTRDDLAPTFEKWLAAKRGA